MNPALAPVEPALLVAAEPEHRVTDIRTWRSPESPGLLLSTWFLPSVAAGVSIYRSVEKKRGAASLVLHAALSAVLVQVAGIAIGMTGLVGKGPP